MARVRQASLRLDVSAASNGPDQLYQHVRIFLPRDTSGIKGIMVCLAGGSYDWHYWHLEVAGHPGYSFAEHLATRGFVVAAVDHLGVGDSTDPVGDAGGLRLLARGDSLVAQQLRERAKAGLLVEGCPPIDVPLFGVGHSMGACLTTMVQSLSAPYRGLALLGYGVQITNVYPDVNNSDRLEDRIAFSEKIFRSQAGVAGDVRSCLVPRSPLRLLFHSADVPTPVMDADDALQSRVPVQAAAEVITPGFAERFAAEVAVPVFLAFGATLDVTPDPRSEPANYERSHDITLFLVDGSSHCHNFASRRSQLWDRLACWAETTISS
jgi:alpha-beta hydrolase superfamily lysophospholipase